MNIFSKRIISVVFAFTAALLFGANFYSPTIGMDNVSADSKVVVIAAQLSDACISSMGGTTRKNFTSWLLSPPEKHHDWLTSLIPDIAPRLTCAWTSVPDERWSRSVLYCQFNI